MKQVIAAVVLAVASGSSMAAGISSGNVDLYGWVVENTPKSSVSAVRESSGNISRNNVDLDGWVVENHADITSSGSATQKSEQYPISKGNSDLYGWVVADVMAK